MVAPCWSSGSVRGGGRTIDGEVGGVVHLCPVVGGTAGVAASVLGGEAADHEGAGEVVEAAQRHVAHLCHRMPVLLPREGDGRVSLRHQASHTGAIPGLQVLFEVERLEHRRHCNTSRPPREPDTRGPEDARATAHP